MPLREARGNMYSWVTHTWNTVKGKCPHDCCYCYMKKWGEQKPMRLDESEFNTDLKSGNIIFVGSSVDLFASDVPFEWIEKTLNHCKKHDNDYLFQTKNPWAFLEIAKDNPSLFPEKVLLCTTIESNRYYYPNMGNTPFPQQRSLAMYLIPVSYRKYVTIEPIMDFDLDELVKLIKVINPVQVNIGADSQGHEMEEPTKEKVLSLIEELEKFTIIDSKNNLGRILNK